MMDRRMAVLIVALMVVPSAVLFVGNASDAETVDNGTWYCYGDHPTVQPMYPGDFYWEVTRSDGLESDYVMTEDRFLSLDLSDVPFGESVTVRQSDGTDTAVVTLIPLHLPQDDSDDDGVYTVTFHDGDRVPYMRVFDASTTVLLGDPFFLPPSIDREGYVFGGWYTHPSCSDEYLLDLEGVVTSDMDIYAKWSASDSTGGNHIVSVNNHVVVFQSVYGLRYDVTSLSGDAIMFTVSPVEGVNVNMDSVEVSADGGSIVFADGVYTLTDIRSDILVSITGLVEFSIEYRLDGVSIVVGEYGDLPGTSVGGPFDAEFHAMDGHSGPSVSVFMGGHDITDEAVSGNAIHIDSITGDLIIVGNAVPSAGEFSFPWWIIIVVVVIVIAAIVVYWYLKTGTRPE